MSRLSIGTKVQASSKSKHSGQKGSIAADYGNHYLVKADDESYEKAFTSVDKEGKYFQVDERYCKEI